MRTLCVGTIVVLAALSAGAAFAQDRPTSSPASQPQTGPGELPTIKSLIELMELKPVTTIDGWQIRLGICEDAGESAGPWQLVYCYAERLDGKNGYIAVDTSCDTDEGLLGPLSIRMVRINAAQEASKVGERQRAVTTCKSLPGRVLFCQAVPVNQRGKFRLEVLKEGKHVLAAKEIEVKESIASPWMMLLQPIDTNVEQTAKGAKFVVGDDAMRYRPGYDGKHPIWMMAGDEKLAFSKPVKGTFGYLPGRLPPFGGWDEKLFADRADKPKEGEERYSLELSLAKSILTIKSPLNLPPHITSRILVRWWVNDKPLPIDPAAKLAMKDVSKDVLEAKSELRKDVDVTLVFPQYMGKLKAGDKVALQVMVCPSDAVIQPANELRNVMMKALEEMSSSEIVGSPILSNRLEFKVTKEMIEERDRPADQALPVMEAEE